MADTAVLLSERNRLDAQHCIPDLAHHNNNIACRRIFNAADQTDQERSTREKEAMKRFCASMVILFVLCGGSYALERQEITLPMRIEYSQRVVIGTLSTDNDESLVAIKEVLKGTGEPAAIRTKRKPTGDTSPLVLYFEADNSEISYLTYVERGSHVWNMAHMLVDPAPQMDTAKYAEHKDIVEILGYLFDSFTVTSLQMPEAKKLLPRRHWESFPWSVRNRLELRCSHDPAHVPYLRVLEITPFSKYSRDIRQYVEHVDMGYRWTDRELPESFIIWIEPHPPDTIGSLPVKKAADYLRARLKSDDPEIVLGAIAALARMHDVEAVSQIILLLDAKDERIAVASADFLGWSRDRQAVEPLCNVLRKNSSFYPQNHQLSDASSRSLKLIGDIRATPCLEAAATHGVEWAYESLIVLGREESFEAVLQSEKGYLPCGAGVCLYWLVRRSNRPLEDWMQMPSTQLTANQVRDWRTWWRDNKASFKIVRTIDEAETIWENEKLSNK